MKRALFLAVALLCPAAPLWPASYEQALDLYLQGDFREALPSVNAAIKENPGSAAALALRARIWHVFGDSARALEDCDGALARSKTAASPEELAAQGQALLFKGQTEKALAAFNTALQADRNFPEGWAGRARAWRAVGQIQKSLNDIDEAVKLSSAPLYYYNRAQAHYDLGLLDPALADLSQSLKLNKKSYLAFGLLGTVLAQKKDINRALAAYDKAISLNPEYSYAYLGRAALRLALSEKEAAFKDFDEAARISGRDYAVYVNRGEAYWRDGDKKAALADFHKALSCGIGDASSALILGERFAQSLLWRQSLEAYDRAYALDPKAQTLIKRAYARENLKDIQKAMADLSLAIDSDPALAQAWEARAALSIRQGQEERGIADLDRAAKLDPKNSALLVTRGSLQARMGKPKSALEDFNAAIALDPLSAEAYNSRGALYANAFNDLDKALRDIVKAGELMPQTPSFQFNLGMMRLKGRQYFNALDSFNRSLELQGPLSRVLQGRAEAYFHLGDQAAALRDIQLALEKEPRNSSLYDTLGAIRLNAMQYEQAVRDLDQALQLDPKNASALIHRGLAYGGMARLKNALGDFKKAAEIDPSSKEAWTDLCQARRLEGDAKASLKDCSKAIEIDAGYAPAYLQRGLGYLALKDPGRTIEDINNASQLGLRRAEGFLAQALAHAAARQYKEAHRLYLQAMSLDAGAHSPRISFGIPRDSPDDLFNAVAELDVPMAADGKDPYVFIVRADALHNAEHYDKAILEYTKAMETDGGLADAYIGRGIALAAQDSLDAAQQDFLRALELNAKDSQTHVRLAVLLTIRRDYKNALAHATAALRLDPKRSEAYLRAGNIYFFQGNRQRALENYEQAARADPLSPAAFNGLGLGYFALKKYPESLENFSRAVSLNPYVDRYYRNRGSVYVNLRKFDNAAAQFRLAGLVNADPGLVDEYKKLVSDAESRLSSKN